MLYAIKLKIKLLFVVQSISIYTKVLISTVLFALVYSVPVI